MQRPAVSIASVVAALVVHGGFVGMVLRSPLHHVAVEQVQAELAVELEVAPPPSLAPPNFPAVANGPATLREPQEPQGEGAVRSRAPENSRTEASREAAGPEGQVPGGEQPTTAPSEGWFSPFGGPTSRGAIDLRAHYTDVAAPRNGAPPSPASPPPEKLLVDADGRAPSANGRAAAVLRAGVDAHEIERGTAAGGEAVSAVAAIGHLPGAPGLGHATFAIRVDGAGISVALADGGAESSAWRALLPALRAALLAHPPRIPAGKRSLSLLIATRIDDQCPDGRAPHDDGTCPSSGGLSRSGLGVGGVFSPENLGRRPNRMVHTRIVSSVAD